MNLHISIKSHGQAAALLRLSLIAAGFAALTGCSSVQSCDSGKGEYVAARDQGPLRVPAGMDAPNRSAALVVPAAARTQTARREGCLEAPPSYFGSSGRIARTPEELVASWAQGWAQRDIDAVLALYSEQFAAPTGAGRGPWLTERREQIASGPVPEAAVQDLEIRPAGENQRIASFVHRFGDNALRKELTLVREAGSWRIVSERVLDVR